MSSTPGQNSVTPTFVQGESGAANIQNLQSLANFAAWLTNQDYPPAFHFYKTATQSIPASASTLVSFPTVAYDTAKMQSSGSAIVRMTGVYEFKAFVPIQSNAAALFYGVLFQVTFGASNPNFAANVTRTFGATQAGSATLASTDTVYSAAAKCPWDLYNGDTVGVYINNTFTGSVSMTTNFNADTNAWQGRVVPSFQGKWIRNAG